MPPMVKYVLLKQWRIHEAVTAQNTHGRAYTYSSFLELVYLMEAHVFNRLWMGARIGRQGPKQLDSFNVYLQYSHFQ
ncbi:hypothetical protein VTK56DRAFT_8695 [Thermocarpiscus australiensis]